MAHGNTAKDGGNVDEKNRQSGSQGASTELASSV